MTLGNRITPDALVKDSILRDDLLTQLRSQSWWKNKVNVIVQNGTVELWGFVDSEAEKDAIRVAVEGTPGVRSVSNNLTVEHMPTAGL